MNNQGYVAWDIEIAKEIPEGVNWKEITPLGISCSAVQIIEQNTISKPTAKYHADEHTYVPLPGAMNEDEINDLVLQLSFFRAADLSIVTWNGLQFDFAVLASETNSQVLRQHIKDIAFYYHVDMMFQLFCILGYPVGLDAVAKGLGLPGKPEDMSGALAPQLWAGSLEDRYKVLEYVKQDAVTTLDVCLKVQELGYVAWTSKAGRPMKVQIDKWLTVEECLQIPEPDTSWMTKPMSRKSFMEWMNPS